MTNKTHHKIHLIILIIALVITSCSNKGQNDTSGKSSEKESSAQTSKEQKKIKQTIQPTGEFYQITNISSATIDFTAGPYSIVAEGDSATLSHISYDIDGSILTITTPMEVSNDIQNYPVKSDVVIHVSCPDLRTIALCAGGGFTCHELLHSEKIDLGGMVGGSIDIDSIECETFRYQSNGSTVLNIGNIKCEEGIVISTGNGTINVNLEASKNAYIDPKGATTMSACITSPLVEGIIETSESVSCEVFSDELKLHILSGNVSLRGKVGKQDIHSKPQAIVSNTINQ